jgi:hypothetical protein
LAQALLNTTREIYFMDSAAVAEKKPNPAVNVTKNVVKTLVIVILAIATAIVLFVGMR